MKRVALAVALIAGLSTTGCFTFRRTPPKPGLTYVGSKPVTIPARLVSNVLLVESKWDRYGPYHFVIDTGSSVTLVSPELAARYSQGNLAPPGEPQVRVRAPNGGSMLLDPVTLGRIQLGSVRFEQVPALSYDCSDLSAQFGVKVDGVLGFPLFRNAVLTLDYPHKRIVLRSRIPEEGLPGEAILFTNPDKTPLIAVRLGNHDLEALIDSGSGQSLVINPAGILPRFAFGPVEGPVVATLAGDRVSYVGRVDGVLRIGSFDIPNPVSEVTDELSSVGGGILSHFIVTFDQEHDEVFFQAGSDADIVVPALRGTGMSFRKTPAYWKVVGVIQDSPAAAAAVTKGDLVSRINGEPVASWDPARFEHLLAKAATIDFTFIQGASAAVRQIQVVDIVP
jgi:hypothetical protein